MSRSERPNLLLCRPERLVGAELGDDGRVILLRPRFLWGPLAWWLQPRLSRPFFRVHLDEVGSFVWQQMERGPTVQALAEAMEQHFGPRVSPALDRLELFLRELQRGAMVRMRLPGANEGDVF